jgi:hypothetical protein
MLSGVNFCGHDQKMQTCGTSWESDRTLNLGDGSMERNGSQRSSDRRCDETRQMPDTTFMFYAGVVSLQSEMEAGIHQSMRVVLDLALTACFNSKIPNTLSSISID